RVRDQLRVRRHHRQQPLPVHPRRAGVPAAPHARRQARRGGRRGVLFRARARGGPAHGFDVGHQRAGESRRGRPHRGVLFLERAPAAGVRERDERSECAERNEPDQRRRRRGERQPRRCDPHRAVDLAGP
ncbi:hypothetical protein LTR16_012381, partial [Cryomyces antarcticus]